METHDDVSVWVLASSGMDTCVRRLRVEAWACSLCKGPRGGLREFDIHIQERKPPSPSGIISWMAVGGLPIVHRSLAEVLLDFVAIHDVAICPVFDCRSELLEWVVLRHRIQRVVRGDAKSEYRVCKECGRVMYGARGREYLVGDSLEGGFLAGSGKGLLFVGKFVHHAMCRTFGEATVRKVLTPIACITEAQDGFSELGDSRELWSASP